MTKGSKQAALIFSCLFYKLLYFVITSYASHLKHCIGTGELSLIPYSFNQRFLFQITA